MFHKIVKTAFFLINDNQDLTLMIVTNGINNFKGYCVSSTLLATLFQSILCNIQGDKLLFHISRIRPLFDSL